MYFGKENGADDHEPDAGAMILYMQLTSQGFMDVLYHNVAGIVVMTVCLGIYCLSFWMGRKIARISV